MHYQDLDHASYESITDFVSAMRQPPRVEANRKVWHDVGFTSGHYGADWFGAGCRDGNAVQTKVMEGWPEGRERINDLRSKMGALNAQPIDRRRRAIWTNQGGTVDMNRIWQGRLDTAWRTAKRQHVRGPQRIEICANMICSGYEHPDVLFWRGAAAVVLLDILEAAGYMVRLTVNFGGRHYEEKRNNGRVSCRITVKGYGAPLDITSTSAVILPGFFRSLGHAWLVGHCQSKVSTCGISVEQGDVEPNEILLTHSVRDHGTALAFVNDTIKRINEGSLNAA